MNHRHPATPFLPRLIGLIGLLGSTLALAHGPTPPTLKGVAVPVTPGLLDGDKPIVVDRQAAIQLGKALFWDTRVGSDGIACASCHFHAGADGRTRNQLAPGGLHGQTATTETFEATASGTRGGPGHAPQASDFPFYRHTNKDNIASPVSFQTDDVFGSAGVGLAQSAGVSGKGRETCTPQPDALFHQGNLNTRRVEPRNTPTVINAAYNFRNFWDGRANNIFNGESQFGARDVYAGIWVVNAEGRTERQTLRLENASLASQAMAPALSDIEMSCQQRAFPDIGRKLLTRRALETQTVHPDDSVLGGLRHGSGKGLNQTYRALIQTAFAPRYWSDKGRFGLPGNGTTPYNQMEANFPLFFGLALQLYQDTLIADDTPFDTPRDENDIPVGLDPQQARGLIVFKEAHCDLCHKGAALTSAAHPQVNGPVDPAGLVVVNRKTLNGAFTGKGIAFALLDEGFTNTSVTPTDFDPGLGATDPYGNPLSFSEQYRNVLLGKAVALLDPVSIKACQFETPFTENFRKSDLVADPFGKENCGDGVIYAKVPKPEVLEAELRDEPGQGYGLSAVMGAFKIPGLRNVELTGPYMHNGGMRTLEEVVDFYNRGGNLTNPHHFATLVFPQGLTEPQRKDLVAFLKSLTDERVRWERAPFDHPELRIPHGYKTMASKTNVGLAADQFMVIPAVGRAGRDAKLGPLQAFDELVP
jgi:cytochrome c peroxidase